MEIKVSYFDENKRVKSQIIKAPNSWGKMGYKKRFNYLNKRFNDAFSWERLDDPLKNGFEVF